MPEIRVAEFEDTVVIHFGKESTRINAYTLASTLSGLADVARAANAAINPGYEIEVVVEGLGAGSFKAHIRTIYRGAANLFSRSTLKSIVLAVIANFIYEHTLAPDLAINVQLATDEVVIEHGDTRIIVPRAVYDASQQVSQSPHFRQGVGQAVRALDADPEIRSVGFSRSMEDRKPPVEVPKERFAALPAFLATDSADSRELIEITDLEILRAILERSRRRWEFVWNGMKIAAPVLDAHSTTTSSPTVLLSHRVTRSVSGYWFVSAARGTSAFSSTRATKSWRCFNTCRACARAISTLVARGGEMTPNPGLGAEGGCAAAADVQHISRLPHA